MKKEMKKISKWFFAAVLLLAGITPAFLNKKTVDFDNIKYDDVKVQTLDDFTPVYAEEDEVVTAEKVIIHYHNDDGGNKDRRFYIWNALVKGVE